MEVLSGRSLYDSVLNAADLARPLVSVEPGYPQVTVSVAGLVSKLSLWILCAVRLRSKDVPARSVAISFVFLSVDGFQHSCLVVT